MVSELISFNPCLAEWIKMLCPLLIFKPIRSLDPDCCYKFAYLMANSADPDQLASSEANWSGSTLFAKPGYIRIQQSASVAQLDAPSDWRPGGRGFNLRRGRQHSFVEIDHEIFSTVILSLPLIQEGQLSVSGERMCTILVNPLED